MRGESAIERLRRHALEVFRAGVAAADPARAVHEALLRKPIEKANRVRVIAFGKAACAMAEAAAAALPPDLFPGLGIAVTSDGSARDVPRFRVMEAGHPLPDERGVEGARAVIKTLAEASEDEQALILISGGGSALLPAPVEGITLDDKSETTRLLLDAGADIRELNTVRKHLSILKGGGMARIAAPARVRALILSDVIGNDLSVIASGPVSPDPTTFAGALAALRRHGVHVVVPDAVRERLAAGARGEFDETPKPGDPVFERVECEIVGSNEKAVEAARDHSESLGYPCGGPPGPLQGEARDAAKEIARYVLPAASEPEPREFDPASFALVAGGETTVTVRGRGKGGRNQELALAFAVEIERLPKDWHWALLSAGTDGIDGPTDAAGAIVDAGTIGRIREAGIDPQNALDQNDSYTALEAAGDLLRTGPTGTNVADLQVLLLERK